MFKRLCLTAAILLGLILPALAQNVTCATRPVGDNSNACASTAFVQQNSGGGGTVTSIGITPTAPLAVTGSPVTSAGNINLSLGTQSANTILAGPVSGSAAAPAFRSLATADLPASILPPTVSITSFGGACDNSTDNATPLASAISALGAQGGVVVFPTGTCNTASTYTIAQSNITLQGQGRGATILNCTGTGTADCILLGTQPSSAVCTGTTPPSNCLQTIYDSIYDMTVQAPSRTGGFLFNVNGCAQCTVARIAYVGWDLLETQYVNSFILDAANGYTNDTTNQGIALFNTITTGTSNGWYRSDVITINDISLNAQLKGASCLDIDGEVQTVRINKVALLDCNYGLSVANSAQSTSFYPGFIISWDLEIDGITNTAINIGGGGDMQFNTCNVDSSGAPSGTYAVVVNPDTSFSYTRGITFNGCHIHDGPAGLMYLNAKDIVVAGSQLYDSSHLTSAAVIETGPVADTINISGSNLGPRFGDPNSPAYGVFSDSGGANIALVGNNYNGATTTSFSNNTSATQSFVGGIGYNGVAISATTCAATSNC